MKKALAESNMSFEGDIAPAMTTQFLETMQEWRQVAREVKKLHGEYVKKKRATGGGPPPTPPKYDALMEATASLIGWVSAEGGPFTSGIPVEVYDGETPINEASACSTARSDLQATGPSTSDDQSLRRGKKRKPQTEREDKLKKTASLRMLRENIIKEQHMGGHQLKVSSFFTPHRQSPVIDTIDPDDPQPSPSGVLVDYDSE
ncbi:hypothetical protein Pcinc_009428 [Petrolisthes cinctipes]|uniref:Uncharacterized protein n=1 Tax=Petrolisthes cinctipes TaxID=88211 RepID=A0AAE1G4R8_PETCI|nr:hypothetical protein Pcinc_009428 [Petrolisthes cinctipes]